MKRLLLLFLAAVLLLCGCSAPQVQDFAPDEAERLVIYTSHKKDVWWPIVKEFEARTGIWVQVVQGGTNELLEQLENEKDSPAADLMFGGGVESLLAYEDYFMPCDAPRDAMLAECRFENHRFVAFSRLPLAIIYNPRLVSRPPAGFADLLDDGLLLWNRTTEAWQEELQRDFGRWNGKIRLLSGRRQEKDGNAGFLCHHLSIL